MNGPTEKTVSKVETGRQLFAVFTAPDSNTPPTPFEMQELCESEEEAREVMLMLPLYTDDMDGLHYELWSVTREVQDSEDGATPMLVVRDEKLGESRRPPRNAFSEILAASLGRMGGNTKPLPSIEEVLLMAKTGGNRD